MEITESFRIALFLAVAIILSIWGIRPLEIKWFIENQPADEYVKRAVTAFGEYKDLIEKVMKNLEVLNDTGRTGSLAKADN